MFQGIFICDEYKEGPMFGVNAVARPEDVGGIVARGDGVQIVRWRNRPRLWLWVPLSLRNL